MSDAAISQASKRLSGAYEKDIAVHNLMDTIAADIGKFMKYHVETDPYAQEAHGMLKVGCRVST